VVVPVYNQERYVAECVASALDQTFADREVVVVDDGSTDRTPEILAAFGDRIRYVRQENRGAAAALNHGVRLARGEYVAWLSSDDVYLPRKLERQVALLDADPAVDLVYTDFCEIDGEGRLLREIRSPYYADRHEFARRLLWNNFVNGSSVLLRRRAFDAAGGFDESMRLHADGTMWFRLLKNGRFGHVPEMLLKYRWHAGNASHDGAAMRRYLVDYYDRVLGSWSLEELFGDRADRPGWRAEALRELGDLFVYRGITAKALASYRRALALAPASPRTWLALTLTLARLARANLGRPAA
jgi:glycosyltransferase involved in cell wall biosynthesis